MKWHYFSRLETIDRLIRAKATGTPEKLAKRLDISERTLFEDIALMKEKGAPIKYCKFRQSYYYEEIGNFIVGFMASAKNISLVFIACILQCDDLVLWLTIP